MSRREGIASAEQPSAKRFHHHDSDAGFHAEGQNLGPVFRYVLERPVRRGKGCEQVKTERIPSQHNGIERAAADEFSDVVRRPMRGAKSSAQSAGGLHPRQELHHPVEAPDIFLIRFAVVDAGDSE
jgi:hypothetical protein